MGKTMCKVDIQQEIKEAQWDLETALEELDKADKKVMDCVKRLNYLHEQENHYEKVRP
uniref:Uncharacterized protein n=1 Tax=viral metagenome TaxID=1070528 RepID=A0A6M3LNS4_9ZZZZ